VANNSCGMSNLKFIAEKHYLLKTMHYKTSQNIEEVETTSHNSKKKPRSNGFYNVNDIL
jgi:hypothetical protein